MAGYPDDRAVLSKVGVARELAHELEQRARGGRPPLQGEEGVVVLLRHRKPPAKLADHAEDGADVPEEDAVRVHPHASVPPQQHQPQQVGLALERDLPRKVPHRVVAFEARAHGQRGQVSLAELDGVGEVGVAPADVERGVGLLAHQPEDELGAAEVLSEQKAVEQGLHVGDVLRFRPRTRPRHVHEERLLRGLLAGCTAVRRPRLGPPLEVQDGRVVAAFAPHELRAATVVR